MIDWRKQEGAQPTELRIEGSYRFVADRETVWAALQSPEVLPNCIPGCNRFETVGEDSYKVEAKVRVAAISGSYTGTITVAEKMQPDSYKMLVEGRGVGSSLKGEGVLSFSSEGDETVVTAAGDVYVTGMVARVGQRLLGSTSKLMMNRFFGCIQAEIDGKA